MFKRPKQGSRRTSLFFVLMLASFTAFCAADTPSIPAADSDTWLQWQALLHLDKKSTPKINSPSFLLSSPAFTPEQEWLATAAMFVQDPQSICLFPARYRLINKWLNSDPEPALKQCTEYQHYLSQAPADEISLVYASENLTNPSSVMGHTMLALEGKRADGFVARHSVSFFVELNSSNPIKVVQQAIYPGSPGYFLLKPLDTIYEFYNATEQRNIWRYALKLDHEQRQMLRDHIWELKHPAIIYQFHNHNCTTLTLDILRVIRPDLKTSHWVTPLDLAKTVERSGIVSKIEVTPSPKWQIRLLNEIIDENSTTAVKEWLDGKSPWRSGEGSQSTTRYLLAEASLRYRVETRQLSALKANELLKNIPETQTEARTQIELGSYRSPTLTPDDSSWTLGWVRSDQKSHIQAKWLLAGHGLEDDNRQYFGENELKLGEVVALMDPHTSTMKLHAITLYAARSLTPYDPIAGGLSGDMLIRYGPIKSPSLETTQGIHVRGGLGITQAAGADLRTYGLVQLGFRADRNDIAAILEPEFGLYLYEVWDMKTHLSYTPQIDTDKQRLDTISLRHSIAFKDQALLFELNHYRSQKQSATDLSLSWRWYY